MREFTIMLSGTAMNEGQAEIILGEIIERFTETLTEFTGSEYVGAVRVEGNRITDEDIAEGQALASQAEADWESGRPE